MTETCFDPAQLQHLASENAVLRRRMAALETVLRQVRSLLCPYGPAWNLVGETLARKEMPG